MYIQVTKSIFNDQFFKFDRQDNFSYEARALLFDYLIEAEDNGENGEAGLELDIIAICCDFTESTIAEFIQDYRLQEDDDYQEFTGVDDKQLKINVEELISNHSIFIGWTSENTFVYAGF